MYDCGASVSNPEKEVIKLNIGGTEFRTSRFTLTKFDGFFKTIVETRHIVTKDASGAIMIDRDPKHFNIILSYMIDGTVDLLKNEIEIRELAVEADYYMLDGLVDLCEKELEERNQFKHLKFISSDEHLFRILVKAKKPLMVINYRARSCRLHRGNHFNCLSFLKRHSKEFDIYFKVFSDMGRDASFSVFNKYRGEKPVVTGPLKDVEHYIGRGCCKTCYAPL